MITLADRRMPSFVTGDEPVSGRLLCCWNAYGKTGIARFYKTEHEGCIAVMDMQAVVCVPPEDREEVAAFLQLQLEIRTVYTTLPHIIDGKETHFTAMKAPVLTQEQPLQTASLRDLYPFLQPFFKDLPPFEAWYLDTSYRTRHGLCHTAVITKNDTIISSAMTVAEWKGGALIGGVATHPDHRRQGHAARLVTDLTATLQKSGKTVWICPYNPPAQRLYRSLGFYESATVIAIERI